MITQASPENTTGAATEQQLVDRARTGDREAFAVLYNETHAEVFHFILGRVHQRQLAEDLTSETYLRALNRIDGFTWQGTSIAAWLVTIARRLIVDHHRSAAARREITTDDLAEPDTADRSAEDYALRELDMVEARSLVQAAVAGLVETQRRCIELRFLHEMSVAETAAVLGRSVGAAKTLQYRALDNLRTAVAA